MGELFAYYGCADVAFVGGSLQPLGGQNLIEPASLGLPVLFGPSMFNFAQASELACRLALPCKWQTPRTGAAGARPVAGRGPSADAQRRAGVYRCASWCQPAHCPVTAGAPACLMPVVARHCGPAISCLASIITEYCFAIFIRMYKLAA
jgi:hypothetical protein